MVMQTGIEVLITSWHNIIIIIIKFKFIPRSFYKNIQLRLTINIKLEIKIEVQNYNSKIMQFNYKNYRTN